MTRKDGAKLLQELLGNPKNQELAQQWIGEENRAEDAFRSAAPQLVEALAHRGIAWVPGVFFAALLKGERGPEVLSAMLEVIARIPDTNAQRILIRHLAFIQYPYDATAIVELFNSNTDRLLRRDICLNLAQTKACNIDAWARRVISDPVYGDKYGDCRTDLVFFSAGLQNKEGLADLLVSVFEEMPRYVPYPLGLLAEDRHLAFMRDRLAHVEEYPAEIRKDLRENLEMAIRKAEKRLARETARKEKLALKEAEKQKLAEDKQRLKDERAQDKRGKS